MYNGGFLMFKKRGQKKGEKPDIQHIVLSAVGVMEDELNGPVPFDDISFCLRVDLKSKIKDAQLMEILDQVKASGLCIQVQNGWQLTPEGEDIVDNVLNNYEF